MVPGLPSLSSPCRSSTASAYRAGPDSLIGTNETAQLNTIMPGADSNHRGRRSSRGLGYDQQVSNRIRADSAYGGSVSPSPDQTSRQRRTSNATPDFSDALALVSKTLAPYKDKTRFTIRPTRPTGTFDQNEWYNRVHRQLEEAFSSGQLEQRYQSLLDSLNAYSGLDVHSKNKARSVLERARHARRTGAHVASLNHCLRDWEQKCMTSFSAARDETTLQPARTALLRDMDRFATKHAPAWDRRECTRHLWRVLDTATAHQRDHIRALHQLERWKERCQDSFADCKTFTELGQTCYYVIVPWQPGYEKHRAVRGQPSAYTDVMRQAFWERREEVKKIQRHAGDDPWKDWVPWPNPAARKQATPLRTHRARRQASRPPEMGDQRARSSSGSPDYYNRRPLKSSYCTARYVRSTSADSYELEAKPDGLVYRGAAVSPSGWSGADLRSVCTSTDNGAMAGSP